MGRKNYLAAMGEKNLEVEIDNKSGFCKGVVLAIERAENFLKESGKLYSLGAIVHNDNELSRLKDMGMEVIGHKDLSTLKDAPLFIRAHGEPPATYKTAEENNLHIVDCTCTVVIRLQKKIKKSHSHIKESGGALLIFGKKGHAEVNGLIGQVEGDATIIESIGDLSDVDFTKPIALFAQTTKDPLEYSAVISEIKTRIVKAGASVDHFTAYATICHQVYSRREHIGNFASAHSVIIFVAGNESANGKMLFEACKFSNSRSYKIENINEIKTSWFIPGDFVGVCGATSTPKWLLEDVAMFIAQI